MSTSEADGPRASDARFEDDMLVVQLEDGRELHVPLEWYPTLRDATDEQRNNFRFIGGGVGIHWEKLDEDMSIRGMLAPHLAGTAGSGLT